MVFRMIFLNANIPPVLQVACQISDNGKITRVLLNDAAIFLVAPAKNVGNISPNTANGVANALRHNDALIRVLPVGNR